MKRFVTARQGVIARKRGRLWAIAVTAALITGVVCASISAFGPADRSNGAPSAAPRFISLPVVLA